MSKILSLFLLLLAAQSGSAQSRFTIEGNVDCPACGVLHIYLVDEQSFSVSFTGIQELEIIVAEAESRKLVAFRFSDVPEGRYAIRCFLDRNGNGKLDRGLFGPTEPWGFSGLTGSLRGKPAFKEVSFPLHDDLSGIHIGLSEGKS